jgi:MFS family permease
MLFAGVLFALTDRVELLLIAAIIGIISPSGYEVGPFLPVEQAALSRIVPDERRTNTFAWYNLVGSFATAVLVPLMPNLPLAILVLFARFSISQMDVPPRQSYTMTIVAPDERSAAAGVTGIARSIGAAISPTLAGLFLSNPGFFGTPFFVAGGLKIIYDILLFRGFRRHQRPRISERRVHK